MRYLLLVVVVGGWGCESGGASPDGTGGSPDATGASPDGEGDVQEAPFTSCPLPYDAAGKACTFEGLCGPLQVCCNITTQGNALGCHDGIVSEIIDDTCAFTSCSPGCDAFEYTTSEGCMSCPDIDALVHRRLEAAADAQGGCSVDDDCVAANSTLACGHYCDLAVRADGLDAYREAAAAIDVADCGYVAATTSYYSVCRPGAYACDRSGDVRCVAGHCRELPVCDPARYQPGDACDDASACTTGDVCVGTRCVGDAVGCDDGNPCTRDACDPLTGCTNVPNADACAAGSDNTCSVGSQCADGACVTSPVAGFDRTYAEPYLAASVIAASQDAIYLAGWRGRDDPSTGYVMKLGADGAFARTVELPDVQLVNDLVALPSGVLLVGTIQRGRADLDSGDILLLRLDASGAEVWRRVIATGRYDNAPRIALAGNTLGVAWYEGEEGAVARFAVTDLAGREPTLTTLGPAIPAGGMADWGMALAAAGDGFVVAYHRRDLDVQNVIIARLTKGGAVASSVTLAASVDETARGVLALPDGDVLVWGDAWPAAWLRRVGTTTEWEFPLRVEAAALRDGALDVLGSHWVYDNYSEQGASGTSWLARVGLDGHETSRADMPRGYQPWDVEAIDGVFVVIGNIASGIGHTADSRLWLRRVSTVARCSPN